MAVGRLDWWKIKGEHTPFEWDLQIAADNLDPIGEERADLRSAVNTANMMAATVHEMTDEQFVEIVKRLQSYIKPAEAGIESVKEVLALMTTGE